MTALYIERYMNYGLTREELQSGRPIIGIAQTGSDLAPCNRHHLELAERVRDGIREAGGVAFEFPVHPIQETGKRPDRRARPQPRLPRAGRGAVRLSARRRGADHRLRQDHAGLPDGRGHGRTSRPSCSPAARCSNGWFKGERIGSGTIVWKARELLAAGEIDEAEFMEMVASSAPSPGHCNTMGTASTMNSLAEALGMSLPGSRGHPGARTATARRIAYADRPADRRDGATRTCKPSDIMTREAFENAIVVNSAIGGSTNAPIHLIAIARHVGVDARRSRTGRRVGHDVPLLVDLQPAGRFLGEDYHRAGGVPAVVAELIAAGLIHEDALTVNGRTHRRELPRRDRRATREVIRTLRRRAGGRTPASWC